MLLILLLVSTVLAKTNNVCKTYSDYATKKVNRNCWYNPDVGAPPHEIVARQGYPFESYEIETEDGHILGIFRIPHNHKNVGIKRPPVYLYHGIQLCSHVWFDHGPRSLAYALSNEGYDVWMANARGTRYSLKHVTYTTKDLQFWNFSYTDLGLYDISSSVKFINKVTQQKVIFIGHSQGTTASYVYAIDKRKEANELLKGIVSLAPVATWNYPRTILKAFVPFQDELVKIAARLGIYSLGSQPILRNTIRKICSVYPLNEICVLVLFLSLGFDYEELLPEDLPMLFYGFPDGASSKSLYHIGQSIASRGRFPYFDYGTLGNLEMYGSVIPPEYDVRKIDLCVHLFYGLQDYVANEPDVLLLDFNLKCSTLNEIRVNGTIVYNHLDYLYGKSVESAMYPILFKRMQEILENDR